MSEFQFKKWWAYFCGENGIPVDRQTLNESRTSQWLSIANIAKSRKEQGNGNGT